MAHDDAWTAASNKAVRLSLVSLTAGGGLKTLHKFNPTFTYPIFGEEQQIFGYQNLKVDLHYHASDMRPLLKISFDKKMPAMGDAEPCDIKGKLEEFLPEVAFQKQSDFATHVKQFSHNWTPPGRFFSSMLVNDETYEIWKGCLAEPDVKQLMKRIQILVTFFIEGGTHQDLDIDADRWTVFFLYQKRPVAGADGRLSYVFAGFVTVFRFWFFHAETFPPSASLPTDNPGFQLESSLDHAGLPTRSRISQFVIIPPFQRKGLGQKLYSTVFRHYIDQPSTQEITVEDPNEAFDDLRDVSDLLYLRQVPEFAALHINEDIQIPENGAAPSNIVDKAALETIRKQVKIAPRQLGRVLEIELMSRMPRSVLHESSDKTGPAPTAKDKHIYKLWRLLLKQRLYRHNKDALGELEIKERIQKLNETTYNVEFDYIRLISTVEKHASQGRELRKRRADGDAATSAEASKKPRRDG